MKWWVCWADSPRGGLNSSATLAVLGIRFASSCVLASEAQHFQSSPRNNEDIKLFTYHEVEKNVPIEEHPIFSKMIRF